MYTVTRTAELVTVTSQKGDVLYSATPLEYITCSVFEDSTSRSTAIRARKVGLIADEELLVAISTMRPLESWDRLQLRHAENFEQALCKKRPELLDLIREVIQENADGKVREARDATAAAKPRKPVPYTKSVAKKRAG